MKEWYNNVKQETNNISFRDDNQLLSSLSVEDSLLQLLNPLQVEPLWNLAYSPDNSNNSFLFVPFIDPFLLPLKWIDAQLVFYYDSINNIDVSTVIFIVDSTKYSDISEVKMENFSGYNFLINKSNELKDFTIINKGIIQKQINIYINNNADRNLTYRDTESSLGCSWTWIDWLRMVITNWFSQTWNSIIDFFNNILGAINSFFYNLFTGMDGEYNADGEYIYSEINFEGYEFTKDKDGEIWVASDGQKYKFTDYYGDLAYKLFLKDLFKFVPEFMEINNLHFSSTGTSNCQEVTWNYIYTNFVECSIEPDFLQCLIDSYNTDCENGFPNSPAKNECDLKFEKQLYFFERKYGITLNESQKHEIRLKFNCEESFEDFNCNVMKYLFFDREDIQQIIADNTLIDPCNPQLSTEDILNDFANNNCSDLSICTKSLDELYEDIGKDGGKLNRTESFINCKALNCILDDLIDTESSNFCDLVNNIEGDIKIIDLKIGDSSEFPNPKQKGYTYIDQETGRITIKFNPLFCTAEFDIKQPNPFVDFIVSAQVLIHESIHAEFWRQATTLLPDGKTLSPIDGTSWEESVREFLNIICTDGDGITDQHEEMMTFWVNKIAHDLWEFNGEVGVPDDYLYLAWQGVVTNPDEIIDPCMLLFITQSEFDNYQDRYEENVVKNDTTLDNQALLNQCIEN
ncbi:MAG: hypothetical protein R2771_05410 [Saprospiraceae bacterium]